MSKSAIRPFGLFMTLAVLFSTVLAVGPKPASVHAAGFPFQRGFPRTDIRTVDFSSPAVVDINGDRQLDVLVGDSNGCVWAFDRYGNKLSGYPITSGVCGTGLRLNGALAIGNIDSDSALEIVAGTEGSGTSSGNRGKVYAWNSNGSRLSGWPREMDWNTTYGSGKPEVTSVALANVVDDSRLEIIAGTNNNTSRQSGTTNIVTAKNVYVYRTDGSVVSGFPVGYRKGGMWGHVSVPNLVSDGYAEIVAPRDHRWLSTYRNNATQLSGWPVTMFVSAGATSPSQSPDISFTRSAASIGDLNGDGVMEIVLSGKVTSQDPNSSEVINNAVVVLKPDGQRFPGWEDAKLGNGPDIVNGFGPAHAPALGDLNRDGKLDIVVAFLDGTIRAYRHDGALLWKYDFARGRHLAASEPVIGDVTGDGRLDVIFGTYSPDSSANDAVRLIGLNASGQVLSNFPLSLPNESGTKRGIRAAPSLADLDSDGDVEILAGSWGGTLYVWDLPGTYNRNLMPWPTGRHDIQRTGSMATSQTGTLAAGVAFTEDSPAAGTDGGESVLPALDLSLEFIEEDMEDPSQDPPVIIDPDEDFVEAPITEPAAMEETVEEGTVTEQPAPDEPQAPAETLELLVGLDYRVFLPTIVRSP